MDKLVRLFSGLLPFALLKFFMPRRFVVYGHLISDRNHFISKYYRYPSTQELKSFITWVESLGYTFVDLESYVKNDNEKKVLLTFDDGFKVIYDELHPILKERGVPYAIFVLTDPLTDPNFYIKTVAPDLPINETERIFLSQDEILKLKDDGVHIGFHTRNHRLVKQDDLLDEELKLQLTIPGEYAHLFSSPISFAYPYIAPKVPTVYNEYMRAQLGYKYFFDTRGFNINETNHFYRMGIDAVTTMRKNQWIKFLMKKELFIFILRQTLLSKEKGNNIKGNP